jgi:hypothetical protein
MSFRPKREPRSACDATGGVLGNPTDVVKGGLSEGSAKQTHGRARGSSRNIRQAESHSGTLPQTTCALCQIFKRPSAAVATSREGHGSPRSGPAGRTDDGTEEEFASDATMAVTNNAGPDCRARLEGFEARSRPS